LGHELIKRGDLGGEQVVGVQVDPAQLGVPSGVPAIAGHFQLIDLGAQPAPGESRQQNESRSPAISASTMSRPETPSSSKATESILIPASSSTFDSL
jgi:hypothetical protein